MSGEKLAKDSDSLRPLRGVLHFYSETGSEGGHWAFMDLRYIKKIAPRHGILQGQTVWDPVNPEREGKVREGELEVLRDKEWDPLPDPVVSDPDYISSSLFRGENKGDKQADQRLMKKFGFVIKYQGDGGLGGTPPTEPHRPYGVAPGQLTRFYVEWFDGEVEQRISDSLWVAKWESEGFHLLRNGDYLAIYDRIDPLKLVWSGMIKLKQLESFAEDVHGLWINTDMEGWDREEWAEFFMEEYPAELIPHNRK